MIDRKTVEKNQRRTNLEIDYAGYSIKGKLHQFNEDRFRMLGRKAELIRQSNKGEVYAVFDGMGSAPKGADAAQYMCDALISFYKNPSIKPNPESFINLLHEANNEVNSWGFIKDSDKELGACAGTVSWIHHQSLYIFHVGDTMGLLLKGDFESDDDYEILTSDQAIGDDLLAFWGMGNDLKIESRVVKIDEGDIIILISDGVLKAVDLKTIAKNIRKWIFTSLEFASKSLCELAERKGSTDDITTVIVEIVEFD